MNPLKTKTDAQLRADKAAILRELSARRRAAKPKVRKVRTSEDLERARAYVAFREEHCKGGICWFCDIGGHDLDRAHITNDGLSKRLEDVRLVVALCRDCHNAHTAGRIATSTLIRLKATCDPDNYDPEFLQLHSVRRLSFP